jgi:hypothetical protein
MKRLKNKYYDYVLGRLKKDILLEEDKHGIVLMKILNMR